MYLLMFVCVCVLVLQGSLQRGQEMHQQGHGTAVCCQDRGCCPVHLQPWAQHRRYTHRHRQTHAHIRTRTCTHIHTHTRICTHAHQTGVLCTSSGQSFEGGCQRSSTISSLSLRMCAPPLQHCVMSFCVRL